VSVTFYTGSLMLFPKSQTPVDEFTQHVWKFIHNYKKLNSQNWFHNSQNQKQNCTITPLLHV